MENNKVKITKSDLTPIRFILFYMKNYKMPLIWVSLSTFILTLFLAGSIIGQYYFLQEIQEAYGFLISSSMVGVPSVPNDFLNNIIIFGCVLLTILIIILILYIYQTVVMTKIAQFIGRHIRKDLYEKLLSLQLSYFDSNPSGDIMSKLTNDILNISNALTQNATQTLTNFFQMFWMLITSFIFSPILATIALFFTPIQLGFVLIVTKKSKPLFIQKQEVLGELNGFVEEIISSQVLINNLDKVDETVEKFEVVNKKLRKIDNKSNRLSSLSIPWINSLSAGAILTSIVSGILITTHTDIEIGLITKVNGNPANLIALLIAFQLFYNNYSSPMYQIFQIWSVLQMAMSGAKRVGEVFNENNEIKEKEKIKVDKLSGEIEIKNLYFSYDGKNDVLKDINLNVKKNEVIGIVGPTGSGKTTTINLLTKFYDIEKGDILFDGISIKNIEKESLRDQVSLVLQDTYIFEATVYENLRYAKSDATEKEIEEVCKIVNADHFIRTLKDGYNTILKNNAEELSQGEKQLIAIARAMLKESPILILDEATSFVDTKTEKDIREGMVFASKNKTTFIIAHRLSTIKHADKILVLKEGKMLELGSHNELIKQKGFYYNLYTSGLDVPEDV